RWRRSYPLSRAVYAAHRISITALERDFQSSSESGQSLFVIAPQKLYTNNIAQTGLSHARTHLPTI
ncbi:MAG: hypothetical protein WB382_08735, partial [Pseudolabrys sp.]